MLSHKLLLKAGYISQLGAGIFSFTPMGWRVINNIKKIIDEEMSKIDCYEANLPVIQPAKIWEESGRIDSFIPPLANFKDRRDNRVWKKDKRGDWKLKYNINLSFKFNPRCGAITTFINNSNKSSA